MQLGPYNLEGAGMKIDGLRPPTGFGGDVKMKEDNMVMNPIGQAFSQAMLREPAKDDKPDDPERPKTYRHATMSARRNMRHFECSLVMPTTEVTRWAAECGFGVPPAGSTSKQWGTGRPAKEFKDGATRAPNTPFSQRGSNFHGHYGVGRTGMENKGDNMQQIEASMRTKRMGRVPGKANAWWSYAANNAPKCILPHVLHGRRSSSSMI